MIHNAYSLMNVDTTTRIQGFKVVLDCNGDRDVVIVGGAGIEYEEDAIARALDCAALAYGPDARITWKTISPNSVWLPNGMQADIDGLCFWAN